MSGIMKNIKKSEVLVLKDQIDCSDGQVVSKTLAQNSAVSITLFAFDKGEKSAPMPPAATRLLHALRARAK